MNLFYKFSAALAAAALFSALLLSGIFFNFQTRTLAGAQQERLAAMARSTKAMLAEAALASDPLMAVDYLSALCSSRPELDHCALDIGSGMRPVKTRGKKYSGPAGKEVQIEVAGGKFKALLAFNSACLREERAAALREVYGNLAAAFLSAVAGAALLGLFLAWRLTRRLKRLAAEAAAVGEGRFGVKTDAGGSDEVSELAAAFNRMSAELAELETMKKNLTASVTHELRSPLGVIETYAGLLLKEENRFNEEDRAVFSRIKENAARLANFVTAMLDLAKFERGKMELRAAPEDPLKIITDAADFLRPKAAEKHIKLAVETSGGGAARLDRELITHAITNLIANALKFSPEGGAVLVRAEVSGGKFRAAVEDTGPGLKPGEAEKLFKPFAQGSAAPGHGGTGLGLALAKHIVELHGGTINCARAPGGGALFTFEIPAAAQ